MSKENYPQEILLLLSKVKGKRAQVVINHILQHGFISTEDLDKIYNYNHPPRAIRDVREAGIPIETYKIKSSEGKLIAAYKFGDLSRIKKGRFKGRKVFSKKFKKELYEISNGKCTICNAELVSRYLQIDHRVPYGIIGDEENEKLNLDDYMLLCASCNRSKSRSCELCENWKESKRLDVCKSCYWGSPENYEHIALRKERRVSIVWHGDEVGEYDLLLKRTKQGKQVVSGFIKGIIRNLFAKK